MRNMERMATTGLDPAGIIHCLTFDLEDWFHFLDLPETQDVRRWDEYDSHVVQMTAELLEFLDECGAVGGQKATFFVLGWVAERFPDLIAEVARRGHEIACHSYAHRLVYGLTPEEFEADLVKALDCIEAASGVRCSAYRAPGFSITDSSLWAFNILAQHGISVDSSVFPARRAHGGLPGGPLRPFILETAHGEIHEIPISTVSLAGRRLAFSGGGYLRLLPKPLLRGIFMRADAPIMTYLHPRDFYPSVPIPPMSLPRQFKAKVNLSRTFDKVRTLVNAVPFGTVSEYLNQLKVERLKRLRPADMVPAQR